MSEFEKRLSKGAQLQAALIEYLDAVGVEYLLSGYESLLGSDGARKIITRNDDTVSLFIRHYPDVSVVKPGRSVLIEVKNSTGIERDCYRTYMSLNDGLDLTVLLFLKNKMLCRVQDLRLKHAKEYDSIARMNVPVSDGVWKEPRQMPDEDYWAYKSAYAAAGRSTSGCSFAFIDFQATRFYPLESITASLKAA